MHGSRPRHVRCVPGRAAALATDDREHLGAGGLRGEFEDGTPTRWAFDEGELRAGPVDHPDPVAARVAYDERRTARPVLVRDTGRRGIEHVPTGDTAVPLRAPRGEISLVEELAAGGDRNRHRHHPPVAHPHRAVQNRPAVSGTGGLEVGERIRLRQSDFRTGSQEFDIRPAILEQDHGSHVVHTTVVDGDAVTGLPRQVLGVEQAGGVRVGERESGCRRRPEVRVARGPVVLAHHGFDAIAILRPDRRGDMHGHHLFFSLSTPRRAPWTLLPVQRFRAAVARVLRYANLVALPYLRPDRFRMEPGRRSSRRSSCAFNATTTVEADIRIAPTLMGRTNPTGARIPAANGTEMRL